MTNKQDYRQLIANLRMCAKIDGKPCSECEGMKKDGHCHDSEYMSDAADAIETILNGIEAYRQELHPVDAVPVVHGRWEAQNDGTHFCGECGRDALFEQFDDYCFREKLSDVCPNCGAKMDGGAEA